VNLTKIGIAYEFKGITIYNEYIKGELRSLRTFVDNSKDRKLLLLSQIIRGILIAFLSYENYYKVVGVPSSVLAIAMVIILGITVSGFLRDSILNSTANLAQQLILKKYGWDIGNQYAPIELDGASLPTIIRRSLEEGHDTAAGAKAVEEAVSNMKHYLPYEFGTLTEELGKEPTQNDILQLYKLGQLEFEHHYSPNSYLAKVK
jgi:hypothetical protein